MFGSSSRRSWLAVALWTGLLAAGCASHQDEVRHALMGPLGRPSDIQASGTIGLATTPIQKESAPAEVPPGGEELPAPQPEKVKKISLEIPPGIPGSEAGPFPRLVRIKGKEKEFEEALAKLFPPLRPLGPELQPAPGPDGKALTLADLQKIAAENSPTLRKALAGVSAARGAMIQAGAYPNPTVAYQAGGEGPGGGPNTGGSVQQTIKMAGKLKLAQAAAAMDLRAAELALRAAQNDLTTAVRAGYFAVIVAQEGVLIAHALAQLTDRAYIFQRQIVLRSGEAATYEPIQIYVQAEQARAGLIQARNRYISAWKQLAVTLNRPEMTPALLAGRADAPVPLFRYDQALQRVLANHTDVRTAETAIQKARYNLRLQEVTPVPDLVVQGSLVNDLSPPGPAAVVASVNVGAVVPLWDQNRGAILQARGQLAQAVEDLQNSRNNLTTRLADAFERYQNNRSLVARYRDTILGNQVRVYRAILQHRELEPDKIQFADIFTSQQALVGVLQGYLAALQAQWTAVVDVANLLQTDDLYLYGREACGEPGPPLPQLLSHEPAAAFEEAEPRPAKLLPPPTELPELPPPLEPPVPPHLLLEVPPSLPAAPPMTTAEAATLPPAPPAR
jgi:cobalt-zinc-cadmium efflux system outer membrane protein